MKRAPLVIAIAGGLVLASGLGGTLYAHQASRTRAEARDILKAYTDSVASAPMVVARLGGRPAQDYGDISVAVQRKSLQGSVVVYEIVADIPDVRRCVGAVEGGRDGASEIRADQRPIRGEDADAACGALAFPTKLAFSHRADLSAR